MTSPSSAATVLDARTAGRGGGIFDGRVQEHPSLGSGPQWVAPSVLSAGLLSVGPGKAGDGPIARFVTRRNRIAWSPLRAALRELGRSHA